MNRRPADRMKAVRKLVGMTREDFAKYLNIPFTRYCTVEQKRGRMTEDEFYSLGIVLPAFLKWLAVEGDISLQEVKNSKDKINQVAAARIEAGQIPGGFSMDSHIKP